MWGKDAGTLDRFCDEIGEERSTAITAMSMDMGPVYEKSARREKYAVNAVISYDHVVQLVTTALDKVRRQVWQDLRKLPDQDAARPVQGCPKGAAQEPRRLDWRPGRHLTEAEAPRRGPVASVRAERNPVGHLRR